ncbi:MAG: hypothetical protein RSE00_02860 [Clostridia bacterium]
MKNKKSGLDNENIKNNDKIKKETRGINKKNVDINCENQNKVLSSLKEYFVYYKKNIKKTHLVIYVLLLLVLFLSINFCMSNINLTNIAKDTIVNGGALQTISKVTILKSIVNEALPLVFIVVLAGITPYAYLSVLGFLIPYTLAAKIANMFAMSYQTSNLIFASVGSAIELFGYALAIAIGVYYCKFSTKRFKYSQRRAFGIKDVKKGIYTLKKDEKKLEKLEKENLQKDSEFANLNVKIPYKQIVISFVVSFVIVAIGILITAI